MLRFITAASLLAVTACAQLTGNPVTDCLAARNAVLQAQGIATATAAIAASNPQSARMQTAAALAAANLSSAIALQTSTCPAT